MLVKTGPFVCDKHHHYGLSKLSQIAVEVIEVLICTSHHFECASTTIRNIFLSMVLYRLSVYICAAIHIVTVRGVEGGYSAGICWCT